MHSLESESFLQMLLRRLERVSADSYWAHRASGVRGSLLRLLEREENGEAVHPDDLDRSFREAFEILSRAAGGRHKVPDTVGKTPDNRPLWPPTGLQCGSIVKVQKSADSTGRGQENCRYG
jgi:hypothetical protein